MGYIHLKSQRDNLRTMDVWIIIEGGLRDHLDGGGGGFSRGTTGGLLPHMFSNALFQGGDVVWSFAA